MSTANFAIPDLCSLISLNLTLALNHIHGDECSIAQALIESREDSKFRVAAG
jgi:hypothetical protein